MQFAVSHYVGHGRGTVLGKMYPFQKLNYFNTPGVLIRDKNVETDCLACLAQEGVKASSAPVQ